MTDSQKWLWLASLLGGGWLLYLLAPVFTPFLVSALAAYLCDPLVDRLESWKLSRVISVVIVFLGMFIALILALLLLVPLIERQVVVLVAKIPEYLNWAQHTAVPWISQRLGLSEMSLDLETLKPLVAEHWRDAGNLIAKALVSASTSGTALISGLASIVLIPVVTFYLLRDWNVLMSRIHSLIPRQSEKSIVQIAKDSDDVLGAFLRGQMLVMLALGVLYSIGLKLAGLELALLIGLLAGLVSFVPYLGFIIGILLAGIAMLVQTHDIIQLWPVLVVFGIGQLLESFLLTPWLVGDRIGLHPVAVIFAILAGGQLFGFFGILLALPIAAVVAVLLRHAHERYTSSQIYDQSNR